MNNNSNSTEKKKLWELMLDGCKKAPKQLYYSLFDYQNGACAMGAIFIAYAKDDIVYIDYKKFLESYPLISSVQKCPVKDCEKTSDEYFLWGKKLQNLYVIIVHLNNEHKWTREKIAGWLMTEIEKDTSDNLNTTNEDNKDNKEDKNPLLLEESKTLNNKSLVTSLESL